MSRLARRDSFLSLLRLHSLLTPHTTRRRSCPRTARRARPAILAPQRDFIADRASGRSVDVERVMSIETRPTTGTSRPLISTGAPACDAARISIAVTRPPRLRCADARVARQIAVVADASPTATFLTAITCVASVIAGSRPSSCRRCARQTAKCRRASGPAAPTRRARPASAMTPAEFAMLRSRRSRRSARESLDLQRGLRTAGVLRARQVRHQPQRARRRRMPKPRMRAREFLRRKPSRFMPVSTFSQTVKRCAAGYAPAAQSARS